MGYASREFDKHLDIITVRQAIAEIRVSDIKRRASDKVARLRIYPWIKQARREDL